MRYAVHGLFTAALLAASTLGAAAEPCTLAGLAWMKGVWAENSNGTVGEERWTAAPRGQLMGSSWFLQRAKGDGMIEAMTLRQDGGRILFVLRHFDANLARAQESVSRPMTFVATSCEANAIKLEGQGAQQGERMSYRRDGDRLTFTGDFLQQGGPVRDEEVFHRTGD